MKKLALMMVTGIALVATSNLRADSATGTTTVSVSVGPEASLSVGTGTTSMTTSNTLFSSFTGTTTLNYKMRTSESTGSGSVTAQVTSDFGGSGGPSVASPQDAGDALTFTCSFPSPGSGCSSAQTASTTTARNAVTFLAGAHSATAGDTGTLSWSLTNDPKYKTGSYSATVTFTISAL